MTTTRAGDTSRSLFWVTQASIPQCLPSDPSDTYYELCYHVCDRKATPNSCGGQVGAARGVTPAVPTAN